jgi:hypothetical protein
MKRLGLAALVAIFALAMVTACRAAEVPWKAADGEKADAAAEGAGDAKEGADAGGAGGELKAALGAAHYDRLIKPIEAKVDQAAKIMEKYTKEKEKPAEKQNQGLLSGLKEQAAGAYLAASLAAKKAVGSVKNEEQKAAITQQFDDPNRQKAIDIYLELASEAMEKKDIRKAAAYYKKVLSIDKDNATAKEALTKLDRELKEAAKTNKKSGKGGSDEEKKSWESKDYGKTGRDNDWSRAGRGTW